ncbi:hypothetical protein MBLNU459_g2730t1 [Dothideomycetes sp. NU459]
MDKTSPFSLDLKARAQTQVQGHVKGITYFDAESSHAKCHRFMGIPYAQSPSGSSRWRKAEKLPPGHDYGTADRPGDFTKPALMFPQVISPMDPASKNPPPMSDEVLYLNMWIPVGSAPANGWPVYFYLHGGFLQSGNPNMDHMMDPSDLIDKLGAKCIFVVPAYRLNVFGYLCSKELVEEGQRTGTPSGNYGFWDQRMALEWTHANIASFGGDPSSITCGGYSAGAFAAFHQLAHDLIAPQGRRGLIRRAVLHSNGCGFGLLSVEHMQHHFDELIDHFKIPESATGAEKLERLRKIPTADILQYLKTPGFRSYRPSATGSFVDLQLYTKITDGTLARLVKESGVQIMIGNLTEEENVYGLASPPSTRGELVERLSEEYDRKLVQKALPLYEPSSSSSDRTDWQKVFARMYADFQLYVPQRGLIASLGEHVPLSHLHRYEIDWRADGIDWFIPRSLGVTHGTDMASIWMYNHTYLTETDRRVISKWLEPYVRFLMGDPVGWGTESKTQVRALSRNGSIQIVEDERWSQANVIWQELMGADGEPKI